MLVLTLLPLLLTLPLSIQFQEFQDLVFGGPYTDWRTNGSLTPTLFRVVLNRLDPPAAIRISVTSEKVTLKNPLTVNVIRGKTVHNIPLPRIQSNQGKKYTYWFATDTLCDDDRSQEQLGQPVYISVASSLPSDFSLRVKPAYNFNYDKPFSVQATPSEPRFVLYTFPPDVDKLDIRAYSDDDMCARLIVRRVNCPLFDGYGMLELNGDYFYQTFTKFAGFAISKSEIGQQFHVAFTVMPDDSLCRTANKESNDTVGYLQGFKEARILVKPVSAETFVSIIPLLIYGIAMIVVLLLTYFKYRLVDCYENNEPSIFEGNDSEANVILDRTWLFDKPHFIISHFEYQKQRLVKDGKYFNIIGILNLIIVFRKKIFCYQVPRIPTTHGIQQRDAPKVVCLLSLVAMGLLGFITNNCPNKTSLHLHIYTSLWIFHSALLWIYSKRHGVRKWQQFYVITVSSMFGFLTFVENMLENAESKIILKCIFLAISMSFTGYFCYQYYYEKPSGLQQGQWITSRVCGIKRSIGEENGVYKPLESKIVYIVIAICCSVCIPLLTLLIPKWSITYMSFVWGKSHVGIYFLYYLIQKVRFEKSSFTTQYKITASVLVATFFVFEVIVNTILILYLEMSSMTSSAAESRVLNRECVLPGIDWNDIRHYNGALSWLIFIVLMDFIDSNLKGVPKKRIFVF